MRSILPITALLAIIKLLAQPAGAPGNVRSWDLVTYTVPPRVQTLGGKGRGRCQGPRCTLECRHVRLPDCHPYQFACR